MKCEGCREALSARLDGEDEPRQRAEVETHLAGCAQCRSWVDDAALVTRLARTSPAPAARGVDVAVLAGLPSPWRCRAAHGLRWVLGGLGLAQFLLGVTQIIAMAGQTHVHSDQVASAGHLWHESAAWNLAIGAGFAWIASRRGRPADAVPMLTVFVVVLGLLSMGDVAAGRVEGEWLLSHAIILCGYAIILVLARATMHFGDPPTGRGTSRRWSLRPADSTPWQPRAQASAPRQRRPDAPAARRRDAA